MSINDRCLYRCADHGRSFRRRAHRVRGDHLRAEEHRSRLVELLRLELFDLHVGEAGQSKVVRTATIQPTAVEDKAPPEAEQLLSAAAPRVFRLRRDDVFNKVELAALKTQFFTIIITK